MIFKCKMCGGSLEVDGRQSIATCKYCGNMQTLPKLNDDRRANLYDRANHFRRNNEFDKAIGIFETILNDDTTDAEAYWSIVLCRYGIEYVKDPKTHKHVPTVNRTQFTSIFDDEDYKSAIKNADANQRKIYEAEANAINEIQKSILAISKEEESFDVFISYKETDAQGRRTRDSVLAQELYYQLNKEGLKTFFSRITLEDKLGVAYEPYIFSALNTAKVMVVIGTSKSNFDAVWVKNEWSRFLALTKKDSSKVLIPAYRDMDPYDLPEAFSHLQAQDMSKIGFMQDLVRGIKKIVGANKPQPTTAVVKEENSTDAKIKPLIKKAFMFLENEDWGTAGEYADVILSIDSKCYDAYIVKMCVDAQTHNLDGIVKSTCVGLHKYDGYTKAFRCANETQREELIRYQDEIFNNVFNKAMNVDESESYFEDDLLDRIKTLSNFPERKGYGEKIFKLRQHLETLKQRKREEEQRKREEEQRKLEAEKDIERKKQRKKKLTKVVAIAVACLLVCGLVAWGINWWFGLFDSNTPDSTSVDLSDTYKLELNNGELTIVGLRSKGESLTELVIPEEIGGYKVTAIGYEAFRGCTGFTSVVIPDSVTTIGGSAFYYCENLIKVTIGSGVTTIGYGAFRECNSLNSVTFGKNIKLTKIDGCTFDNCKSLTSITIPDGVTTIGDSAFAYCDNLTSIVIPDSVTAIYSNAFDNCGLKTVYFAGTKEQWKNLTRDFSYYHTLSNVEVAYNYTGE